MFDLDKVEPWQGRAARAIILGHQFHGVNIELGGYNRVQTYLKVHGKYQLEAVGIVHLQWKGGCL